MHLSLRQFILFSGIGAIGTAGHYICLILLVERADMAPTPATTVGFIVGAIINYLLNYHITFKSNQHHHVALTKFFIVAAIGAGINMAIMYFATEWLTLHYLLAQIMATAIVLLWNFFINKYWTF